MKYNESNKPLACIMTNSTCYKQSYTMEVKGILIHSTGANNPNIKRYVQPSSNDINYKRLMSIIGTNSSKNDWNHTSQQAGVNAFIGKLADGSVATVQTLPWDMRPWGCGSGSKGSCNNGWIQFEIAEDGLTDKDYFNAVYKETCELVAYLCQLYNLDPHGTVLYNGVKVPVILCHADSYKLGVGSNHGDILHWFPKQGKTLDNIRDDVAQILEEAEDEDMTQEKFSELMTAWLEQQSIKEAGSWSADSREWAESNGFVKGDANGRKMYKKFMTREEAIVIIHRILKKAGLAD